MKQDRIVQKYNADISKGATIGADDAQETFSSISVKKWMKNKMSNYLSISINDATFDLNITLNTMVECDPLRFYYCNLFEEY